MPGVLFAFSSIWPRVRWLGSSPTRTGPSELVPRRSNCVISVGTWSSPSPSVSEAWPLSPINTSTVEGPDRFTTSLPPLGKAIVICASEIGNISTSLGDGGRTVTVKVHRDELPQESLATQTTVVAPGGKVLPLGGVHSM